MLFLLISLSKSYFFEANSAVFEQQLIGTVGIPDVEILGSMADPEEAGICLQWCSQSLGGPNTAIRSTESFLHVSVLLFLHIHDWCLPGFLLSLTLMPPPLPAMFGFGTFCFAVPLLRLCSSVATSYISRTSHSTNVEWHADTKAKAKVNNTWFLASQSLIVKGGWLLRLCLLSWPCICLQTCISVFLLDTAACPDQVALVFLLSAHYLAGLTVSKDKTITSVSDSGPQTSIQSLSPGSVCRGF